MKKIVVTVAFIACVYTGDAQTFDEWFRQKETQVKYLIEQIAALKGYEAVMEKGYEIAHSGLTTIFKSKDGDYNQHRAYFLSLWKVKGSIRTYLKIESFYAMKRSIEKEYRIITSSVTPVLNEKERSYIGAVYLKLLDDCNSLSTEMEGILSDDRLQLRDDERIQGIDRIYLRMQNCYDFSRSFTNGIKVLVANRLKERAEITRLSSLYHLK